MGYDTKFEGSFNLDKPLSDEHFNFLIHFVDNKSGDNIPESYCQWSIAYDKKTIEWDGAKEFHEYVEWIEYLVNNFIKPWGYILNGHVKWYGEDKYDKGSITISDNIIKIEDNNKIYSDLINNLDKVADTIDKLEAKIIARDKYIEYLENCIRYMPDGAGALEAKAHFLSLQGTDD